MKNILLKSISLLLVIIMLATALFSCATKPDNSDESGSDSNVTSSSDNASNDSSSDEEEVDPDEGEGVYTPTVDQGKFPENAFPVFDGSAYTLKVVVSDKASADERQVATTLRSELKKKTKTTISQSTDYLEEGKKYDANAYEILVGQTKHTESTMIYNTTDYNNYGIKTIGNKIVVYFSDVLEGKELVTILINALKNNDKKAFWFEGAISASKITSPILTGLPKYPSSTSVVDCGDNTSLIHVNNTTYDVFNSYCISLVSGGYEEYSRRDNISGIYFRTYTKGSTAVTAYFSTAKKTAKIIVGPIKDIPSKDNDTTKETYEPSLTMIGPSESVSGSLTLIYMLANGKFLIIDGGIILADRIYKELVELQPNATKYTIAGWFISHPHNDHQDGIEYFIEQHGHEVEIENIYFNYAKESYYDNLTSKDHQKETDKEGDRVAQLREILETKVTRSTKIVKPHTGQIYNFGSASVEIISTVEDIMPTALPHVNESSMVIRVTVEGQSTMVLADASSKMKGIILEMYGKYVKSDIVTLAHHGVWDTTPLLYTLIQAKVLLWPNNTEGARMYYTNKSTTSESRQSIQAALDQATDVFLAKGTDTKLNLPYTPIGNKQDFINKTLK